jgi:uncharacterized protein (TIGR04255 family)
MAHGRGKLSQAPVVYSLVQVRFSPILTLHTHLPAIQEKLRAEYPRYALNHLQTIRVGIDGKPESGEIEPRWDFANRGNNAGIRLQTGSFVYHCSKYTIFDDFLQNAVNTLNIVHEIARIDLVERVGVRYVDLVVPGDAEAVTDYLIPSLSGFPKNSFEDTEMLNSISQTTMKTKFGILQIRCLVSKEGVSLPPDLITCNLTLERQPPKDRISALMDTDHFSELSFDFGIDDVRNRINALHEPISRAFWSSITDHACTRWK